MKIMQRRKVKISWKIFPFLKKEGMYLHQLLPPREAREDGRDNGFCCKEERSFSDISALVGEPESEYSTNRRFATTEIRVQEKSEAKHREGYSLSYYFFKP